MNIYLIDINKYEKDKLVKLKNVTSAVFLLDQKVEVEEFISRKKEIAIDFNNLTEEQKMMIRNCLRTVLNDHMKNKLGKRIEDILIVKKSRLK